MLIDLRLIKTLRIKVMFKKQLMLSSLFIASIALSNAVSATPIINGTFDADLSGWSTVTNGGTAQWAAGQAVLSTGDGVAPFSSVLVQGDDGLFNFITPIVLGAGDDLFKFDAVFTTLGADAQESGLDGNGDPSLFTDNLIVKLYDAVDFTGASDYTFITIDALTSGSSFSFDLSSFIGRSVAFSFELNDENNGTNSQVTLDNIRIEQRATTNTVPLPGTLLLVIIGWFGLTKNLLRNNRKAQC